MLKRWNSYFIWEESPKIREYALVFFGQKGHIAKNKGYNAGMH